MEISPGDASPQAVGVVEVAPRDGLQNESAALSPTQRAELVSRAVAAGARRVEAAHTGTWLGTLVGRDAPAPLGRAGDFPAGPRPGIA
ncbi:hypothetical protein OHB05_41740 [Streptomyces sp. NBC_00638]|uniref:hypothetical protein n=1 Tax=unclassified Streptomyces TaxID=2593676 RepID=UPI00225380A2|nr:hypothetical protein [Streptomyces sp. NBC_00638]MCX5009044.1 hypothetical protein [Streptomyces sp. NBC_00638]